MTKREWRGPRRRLILPIVLLAAVGLERGVKTEHTFSSYEAKPLQIHGPYDLSRYDLVGAPTPETITLDDATLAQALAALISPPRRRTAAANKDVAVVDHGKVETAPEPTSKPFRTGLTAIDAQVAAGKWALLVGNNGRLAFYGKDGKPLPSILDGQPMSTRSSSQLFGKPELLADINAVLNLPAQFDTPAFYVDQYIDLRVVYDDYRDRFWIGTEIVNGKTRDPAVLASSPEARYARRNKFIAGVSKTSDPREGFWLYWWDNVVDDGACTTIPQDTSAPAAKCPGYFYAPGDAADFPHLGISRTALVEGTHVATGMAITTDDPWGTWSSTYGLANIVPADALAQGQVNPSGWTVYGAKIAKPSGGDPVPVGDFVPTVNHAAGDPGNAAFLLNVVDNGWHFNTTTNTLTVGSGWLGVWTMTMPGGFANPPYLTAEIVPVFRWRGSRPAFQKGSTTAVLMGGGFHGAAFRNGTIYTTWAECSPSNQLSCTDAIRLTAIDTLASFTVTRDATILPGPPSGSADVSAPALKSAWPALDVNAAGDVGLVFLATSAAIYPEADYVMWFHGSSTHTARGVLQQGLEPVLAKANSDPPMTRQLDHLGASADPYDGESIWMAGAFADEEGGWEIVVGKGWGIRINPDLLLARTTILTTVLRPGDSSRASAEIRNIGDGNAPPSQVTFYLSRDASIATDDTAIGGADLPAVASGEGATAEAAVMIPFDLPPGEYFLGAIVRPTDPRVTEYDVTNNTSNLAEQTPTVFVRPRG